MPDLQLPELSDLPGNPKEISPTERTLLSFSYGLYVIGSHAADGTLNLMLADWVMQVSFKPRLVAVAIENDARTLRFVRETGALTLNVLARDSGMAIAQKVVMPAEGSKIIGRSEEYAALIHDKLALVDYSLHQNGCPVLDDGLGWLACEVDHYQAAGDHTIVVSRVTDGGLLRSSDPLTQHELGWEYAG